MLSITETKQISHEFTNDIVNYLLIYTETEINFNSYLSIYIKAGNVLANAASDSHFNTECLIDFNSYLSIYINTDSVLMSKVLNIDSESETTADTVNYFLIL